MTAPGGAEPGWSDGARAAARTIGAALDGLGAGPLPCLAVGVSGGPDSLGLMVVAARWAAERGGSAVGLILDHGLRPGSDSEAEATRAALDRLGLAARLLRPPAWGIASVSQARARAARLDLLQEAAALAGATHLLLGHHRGDQAETLCLRRLAGSFAPGLAGMAQRRFGAQVVIARPALEVGRGGLEACAIAARLVPIADPSNRNPRFTRARLRAARLDPAGEGPATAALDRAAQRFGLMRARSDRAAAEALARMATLRPEGFAWLDPSACRGMPVSVLVGCLARLVWAVGGGRWPAATGALEGLAGALAAGEPVSGRTLGGAVLALRQGRVVVAREAAGCAGSVKPVAGALWDGRWRIAGIATGATAIGPLGPGGLRRSGGPGGPVLRRLVSLPAAVRVTLPAFFHDGALTALPHLGYHACGEDPGRVLWQPPEPVAGAAFQARLPAS